MILMRCRGKPAKAEPAATEDLTEESPCRARAVVAVCTEGEQAILARKTFCVLRPKFFSHSVSEVSPHPFRASWAWKAAGNREAEHTEQEAG